MIRLQIDRWHPATVNQLLKNRWEGARLKKRDKKIIAETCMVLKPPKATGKRRVHLTIVLKSRQRGADVDAQFKSLLDALKHAGLLVDDNSKYAELAPVEYLRGDSFKWGTLILLEDIGDL